MEDGSFIKAGREIAVQPKKDLTKSVEQSSASDLPEYWEADYVRNKIANISPGMHKVLYQTMWMTGVRITEALNIRKRDIDFRNYTITIRWQKNRKYNYRNIACHPKLHDILEVYTAGMNLDDKLFPLTRQRAWQLFKRDFRGKPHKMRHSFAVHWLRSGGSLTMLSKALGHSRIDTTMIYLRVVPKDIGEELIKVDF